MPPIAWDVVTMELASGCYVELTYLTVAGAVSFGVFLVWWFLLVV